MFAPLLLKDHEKFDQIHVQVIHFSKSELLILLSAVSVE